MTNPAAERARRRRLQRLRRFAFPLHPPPKPRRKAWLYAKRVQEGVPTDAFCLVKDTPNGAYVHEDEAPPTPPVAKERHDHD
jgi:hypothetical protein